MRQKLVLQKILHKCLTKEFIALAQHKRQKKCISATNLDRLLVERIQSGLVVSAGEAEIDVRVVDKVENTDVTAEGYSRHLGVDDGVQLDEVQEQHDEGEKPPEGRQEAGRERLEREKVGNYR